MNESIPQISPLLNKDPSLLWSVMIPTFNCGRYLKKTLESVLSQDPGPQKMQIEVIDDCSTADDPESLVKDLGKGRVHFFRRDVNSGPTSTFNTCIHKSKGELIHILHGDDYVENGFYQQIGESASQYPQAALYGCRSTIIDENNQKKGLSPRVPDLERFRKTHRFLYTNPFCTPAVVIRRKFYEKYGGYHLALIHTADREMFIRAISEEGGVVIDKPLANYRFSYKSHARQLWRTGENIHDQMRLSHYLKRRYPFFDTRKHRLRVSRQIERQISEFKRLNDKTAIVKNEVLWWKISLFRDKFRRLIFLIIHAFKKMFLFLK